MEPTWLDRVDQALLGSQIRLDWQHPNDSRAWVWGDLRCITTMSIREVFQGEVTIPAVCFTRCDDAMRVILGL